MEKFIYAKPEMRVIKIQQESCLLTASGDGDGDVEIPGMGGEQ